MDDLRCGDCHEGDDERRVFHELSQFIHHKSIHAKQKVRNGTEQREYYECLLCPQAFSRRAALFHHYKVYHKLILNDSTKSCDIMQHATKPRRKSKADLKSKQIVKKDVSPQQSSVCVSATTEYDDHDVLSSKDLLTDDFYFCLSSDYCKGASINYLRTYLACLYCQFRSSVILELVNHMQINHLDRSESIEYQHESDDIQNIVRMSDYIQQTSTEALNDENEVKTFKKKNKTVQSLHKNKCHVCLKYFTNANYLKKHLESQHEKPKTYKCDLCDYTASARYKLTAHMKKHMSKEFNCDKCDFVSDSKAAIRMHRQIHNSGSFICEICGKAFTSRDSIQKHKNVHDKARPYACTFAGCTLRFHTERMCKGHLKTHYIKTTNFTCDQCGYSFRHRHHLKRHLEGTHKVPYIRKCNQMEKIETCEVPVSEIDEKVKQNSLVTDSDVAAYNLKGIILSGEAFDLPIDQPIDEVSTESASHPLMLLNQSTSVKTTDLEQAEIIYENSSNSQSDTMFIEQTDDSGQIGNPTTVIQVISNKSVFVEDINQADLEQQVLLEQTDTDMIGQVDMDHQVSVVEYIVQAEGVTFTATANDDGDSLFP